MAVKLSSEQEKNVRDFLDEAQAFGASPMETLAGVEAMGTEANYGNPDFGDRDSLGAFQQRTPWGSTQSRLNVKESGRRFLERARAARQSKEFKTAGELAQAVQVSAYPDRYHAKRSEAKQILQQLGSSGAPGGGGAGGTGLAADLNGTPDGSEFDATRGQVSPLEINRPAPAPVSAPTAPAAAAGPVMPEAYGGGVAAPMAGAPQAPAEMQLPAVPDYSQSFGTPQAQQAAGGSDTGNDTAAQSGAGAAPRVTVASGANAAGRPIAQPLLTLLDDISSQANRKIVVTTGTNHDKMTTSGNVSEHYTGHGADIASTGKELTDGATDALLATARGKKVQWLRNDGKAITTRVTAANARKLIEAGGIFNIPHGKGRVQLIANTHQGGDHTNHWHVGLREG